jgi:hypothetical protein
VAPDHQPPQLTIYLRVSAPPSKSLLTTLHEKHGKQPFLPKGSESPQVTNRCNQLYICALAHHLQNRYSLPFTKNTENSPFCRRVVSGPGPPTAATHYIPARYRTFFKTTTHYPSEGLAEKQRNTLADVEAKKQELNHFAVFRYLPPSHSSSLPAGFEVGLCRAVAAASQPEQGGASALKTSCLQPEASPVPG